MARAVNPAPRNPGQGGRPPGRPRRPDVEAVVLQATIDLLAERGLEGTTMSAVVERSGVARATVWLRWPNRQALLTAAVREAMKRPVIEASGDVEQDLRRGVKQTQAVFTSPAFRAVFPALVAGLTVSNPDDRFTYEAISPGSLTLADEYRELAAAQGFRDDLPPRLVIDAVVGAVIGCYLSTGEPPDDAACEAIVAVAIEGLRRR